MKILFAGTPDFAAEALIALVNAGFEIPAVITMPDKPQGRKKEPVPSPVKIAAEKLGLPVYQPTTLKTEEAYNFVAGIAPDLMVVSACGHILPKNILELPKYGCINEHASILPAYRGAAPIQWALLDGCEETGVSIMQMDEGLDTGDILSIKTVPISKEETGGSLFDKLSHIGAELLIDTIKRIEAGTAKRTPQPKQSTTAYARMIQKKDGLIDWNRSANDLERFIRGMDPWPGAYTFANGKKLQIWKAKVCEAPGGEVGRIVCEKDGAVVQTGNGGLKLLEIQMEGKKRMDCASFLRGCKLEKDTVLGQ